VGCLTTTAAAASLDLRLVGVRPGEVPAMAGCVGDGVGLPLGVGPPGSRAGPAAAAATAGGALALLGLARPPMLSLAGEGRGRHGLVLEVGGGGGGGLLRHFWR
jgi:hypothetical protein